MVDHLLKQHLLFILGMHRSGTSAVAGQFHQLGVHFGTRLMPPTSANARGFFEHVDVVNLHDRLLLQLDSSWDDVAPTCDRTYPECAQLYRRELEHILENDFDHEEPLWGIKDPRLCRLLSWWKPLVNALPREPIFIIVFRNPDSVAQSLATRDGFSFEKSYLLWLQHYLNAEQLTRGHLRLFINFENFLSDWQKCLSSLETLLPSLNTNTFLDAQLTHHQLGAHIDWIDSDPMLIQTVQNLFAILNQQASVDVPFLSKDVFHTDWMDQIAQQLPQLVSSYLNPTSLECAKRRLQDKTIELAALRHQAKWHEEAWQRTISQAQNFQSKVVSQKERLNKLRSELDQMKAASRKRKVFTRLKNALFT